MFYRAYKFLHHTPPKLGGEDKVKSISNSSLFINKRQSDAQNSRQCKIPEKALLYIVLLCITKDYFYDSNS